MKTDVIFVGGPGRSGTSFVADRIGRHAQVATFQDIELKVFGEFGGMRDMPFVLVKSFSPNRAEMIFTHFPSMLAAVFGGGYVQLKINRLVPAGLLETTTQTFLDRLHYSDI